MVLNVHHLSDIIMADPDLKLRARGGGVEGGGIGIDLLALLAFFP